MKKSNIIIFLILFSAVCFSQNKNTLFEKYHISGLGTISIPSNMEIQSGSYKIIAKSIYKDWGYEISDDRVVFQQKGVNNSEQSASKTYVRVIVETIIGEKNEFYKLKSKINLTKEELSAISEYSKSELLESSSKANLKIVSWHGASIVTVNGMNCLKISFLRQIANNPPVLVEVYRFFNNDRIHLVTFSYRKSDELTWKPLFNKVLNSFTITNVR